MKNIIYAVLFYCFISCNALATPLFEDPNIKCPQTLYYEATEGDVKYLFQDQINIAEYQGVKSYDIVSTIASTSVVNTIRITASTMQTIKYTHIYNDDIYSEDYSNTKHIDIYFKRGGSEKHIFVDSAKYINKLDDIYQSSSLLYSFRGSTMKTPGNTVYFRVFTGDSLYSMYATLENIEIISVPAGSFKCYKIAFGPSGLLSAVTKYYIWISADENKYMVKYVGHNGMPWQPLSTINLIKIGV